MRLRRHNIRAGERESGHQAQANTHTLTQTEREREIIRDGEKATQPKDNKQQMLLSDRYNYGNLRVFKMSRNKQQLRDVSYTTNSCRKKTYKLSHIQ